MKPPSAPSPPQRRRRGRGVVLRVDRLLLGAVLRLGVAGLGLDGRGRCANGSLLAKRSNVASCPARPRARGRSPPRRAPSGRRRSCLGRAGADCSGRTGNGRRRRGAVDVEAGAATGCGPSASSASSGPGSRAGEQQHGAADRDLLLLRLLGLLRIDPLRHLARRLASGCLAARGRRNLRALRRRRRLHGRRNRARRRGEPGHVRVQLQRRRQEREAAVGLGEVDARTENSRPDACSAPRRTVTSVRRRKRKSERA